VVRQSLRRQKNVGSSAGIHEEKRSLSNRNSDDSIILTLRRLMSYIYGAPILDVSRSHTTTQHSR